MPPCLALSPVPAVLDTVAAHCSIDPKAKGTRPAWVGRRGKASTMSSAQFCHRCGQQLLPDVRFCTACGYPTAQPAHDAGQRSGDYGADLPPDDYTIPPAQQPRVDPPRGQPPRGRPSRGSRRPLLAVLIAVIVIGAGTGIAIAAMQSHKTPGTTAAGSTASHGSHSPAVSTAASSTPTSAPSSGAPVPSREQAAQALAGLLSQSGSDRAAVVGAVAAVQSCSGDLSRDETVFRDSASSRQSLLTKLSDLPHRSALPMTMLDDLTAGWQASVQADQDFATWVRDEISAGCSTDSKANLAFADATAPDNEATADKKAFLRQWNPIAATYSLQRYQYTQI